MKNYLLLVLLSILLVNPTLGQVAEPAAADPALANPDQADTEPEQAAIDGEQDPAVDADDQSIRRQVVKIHCSSRAADVWHPWKRGNVSKSTGSGVWLGDGKILTNAHVVSYATQLYVQPFDSSERIEAEVLVSSPEMDLAIVELEDASAFEDLEPLTLLDELPALRSAVQVYGYPRGGAAISVTEGVVSRIEYTSFYYDGRGLRIQIDAALNPGNSGGPAIVDGHIAGLVFSRLNSGDNIGYLIPSEEIQTFLKDVEDGTYDGKVNDRELFQSLQNKALRKRFGLSKDQTGMVVIEPFEKTEDYPLQLDDVLTHVGPHDVDNEGMVRLSKGLRLRYTYFVPKLIVDGKFPATIIRDGQTMEVQIPVGRPPRTVMRDLKGAYPEYFVYGPLVLVEATADHLGFLDRYALSGEARYRAYGQAIIKKLMSQESPLVARVADPPAFEDEQIVLAPAALFPHKISKGYDSPSAKVLAKINGTKIRNMKHVVQLLRDTTDDQIKFEFADKHSTYLVFDREAVEEAMEDILVDNGIARQGSKSLLRAWNKEPSETE